jgi:hypothetical protein
MPYVKSFLAGICGAVVAVVLWVLVSVVLPASNSLVITNGAGAGAIASDTVISEGSVLLAALTGFVIAAAWSLKRSRLVRRSG